MADHVFDVCVVGAGIVGSSAAYNCTKHTNNVVLCEQFPLGHSRGSSHGHSRIIRLSYVTKHFSTMMPEAYEVWKVLESLTNTDLLVTTGLLSIEDEPHNGLKQAKQALVEGKSKFKLYESSSKLKEDFPMLDYPESYHGIYEPVGGVLKADKCCAAFQVIYFEIIPGDIVTLVTNKGSIKAKSVIIAAGPWTNDLLQPLGLKLPLKPMKINVCYWQTDTSCYSADNGFPCFIDYSHDYHIYGLPVLEYPGLLKVCYHNGNYHHPDNRDLENDDKGVDVVGKYLKRHFKGVAEKPSIVEKCYYTWTPDENYVIDRHPILKNIIVGAGFSGHGFKLAPVTGKLLSQLALDVKLDYDISPFCISRFPNTTSPLKSSL
eukprot:gene13816-15261_t